MNEAMNNADTQKKKKFRKAEFRRFFLLYPKSLLRQDSLFEGKRAKKRRKSFEMKD